MSMNFNKSINNQSAIDVINANISTITGNINTLDTNIVDINSDITTINNNATTLTSLNADDVSIAELTTTLTSYPTKTGNNTFSGQNIFSGQTQLGGSNYVGSSYNTYTFLQGQTVVGTPDNSGSNALTVKCNTDFQANNTYTGNCTWSGYNISNGTTELRGNNIIGSTYNTGNTLKGTTNIGESSSLGNFVVKCPSTLETVPKLLNDSLAITDSTELITKKYAEDNSQRKLKSDRAVWSGATIWNNNTSSLIPPPLNTTALREKKFLIRFDKKYYTDTNGTIWNATNSVTVECCHTIQGTTNTGVGSAQNIALYNSRVINKYGVYTLHVNGRKTTTDGKEISIQQHVVTSSVRTITNWSYNGVTYYYTPFTFELHSTPSIFFDRILVTMQMPQINNIMSEGNTSGIIASFCSSLRIISSLGHQQTYDLNYYPQNSTFTVDKISQGGGAYIEAYNEDP